MKKYFKKIFPFVLLAIILISAHPVLAVVTDSGPVIGEPYSLVSVGLKAITNPIQTLMYVLGYIAGMFVSLGGGLVNWALNLNSHVIQGSTVQIGWVISRDLANLGFVLAIILIAFLTILRLETYNTKKILWRLIIAALLINFSLVIAGVFLDFSGVLTDFFINKATSGAPSKLGDGLAKGFQVQKLLVVTQDSGQINKLVASLGTSFTGMVAFIASLFFITIFTGIAAISLIALAAMLFIRYIWLTILLVLAPLAWLAWVWPDLEGYWHEWWSNFLKWTLFAPAMSFFIYLALAIVAKGNDFAFSGAQNLINPSGALGLTIENIGGIIGQMLAVLGILTGGLFAAQRMGITGADTAMKFADGFKGTILGGTTRVTGGFIGDRLRSIGSARDKATGEIKPGLIQRTSARFAGSTIFGGIAGDINRWAGKGGEELVSNYEKEYGGLDKTALLNIPEGISWRADVIRNPAKAAAFINTAAEKGLLNDVRAKQPQMFESLIEASRKMGTEKKIFSRNPTLAGVGIKDPEKRNAEVKKWITKTSPADIVNLNADDIFKEPEKNENGSYKEALNLTVLLNLTKPQLKRLSMDAKATQIAAINKGIEAIQNEVDSGQLKIDSETQEGRNWQYLKNWDNDSIPGQANRESTKPKIPLLPGWEP